MFYIKVIGDGWGQGYGGYDDVAQFMQALSSALRKVAKENNGTIEIGLAKSTEEVLVEGSANGVAP